MEFLKPDVNDIWAISGDIIQPASVRISQGWVSEIPDSEFENWIQNRQDSFIAHVNQLGVVAWDSTTEYLAGKSYVQASNGIIYKALTTNTNKDPKATNSLDWKLAFNESGFSYSKLQSDTIFPRRDRNLSDLLSAGSARSNLSVYSKSESDNKFEKFSILVGMTVAFPTAVAPNGWLACDGSAVSRLTYVALFNMVGTTFGNGDGSTTFNLPDLRGEFIRGFDGGRGVDPSRVFGSSQSDGIKSHNHTATSTNAGDHAHSGDTSSIGDHTHAGATAEAGNHRHSFSVSGNSGRSNTPIDGRTVVGTAYTGYAGNHAHSFTTNGAGGHSHSLNINSAGEHNHTIAVAPTGGTETRPRNVAMLYCIKH